MAKTNLMKFKLSNEVKVGIIGLIVLSMLIYGLNFLNGSSYFNKSLTLFSEYPNAKGLKKGAAIYYNGIMIGKVKDLRLNTKTYGAVAELHITEDIKIPKDSKSVIFSEGIMGPVSIRLELGESTTMVADKGTLTAEIEGTLTENLEGKVDPIRMQVEVLSKQLNNIASWVNYTLDSTGSRNTLIHILDNANESATNVRDVSRDLDDVIAAVNKTVNSINDLANSATSVVRNVEDNKGMINNSMAKIDGTIDNVKYISDSLARATVEIRKLAYEAQIMIDQVKASLENVKQITAGLEKGEGSAGKLLKDDALYLNTKNTIARLDSAVQSVDGLLNEIKANPRKYLNVKVVVFERKKD